jgi:hypothetical protein
MMAALDRVSPFVYGKHLSAENKNIFVILKMNVRKVIVYIKGHFDIDPIILLLNLWKHNSLLWDFCSEYPE